MKFLSVIAFIAIFFAACDDMKQPIMDIAGEMGIAEEEAIPEETEISEAIPEEIPEEEGIAEETGIIEEIAEEEVITEEVITEEVITEEVHPDDEELTTLVTFEIDGIENQIAVFLNSDAALNSKKFQDAIVYAMDYNDRNCGKREKEAPEYGDPVDFSFLTEDEANVFGTHAIDNYEAFGRFESSEVTRFKGGSWWWVTLFARCHP